MTPFPDVDAEAAVKAFEARRWSGAASVAGAVTQRDAEAEERRDTGMIVAIEVGVTVRTDPTKLRGADDKISQQDGAMSGIVLDSYAYRDGEDRFRVGWRVFNPFAPRSGKRFSRWPEDVLDLWATERTDPHVLARSWRWMLRIVADGARGSDLPTGQEAQIAEDAHRLLHVLMAEGGRK